MLQLGRSVATSSLLPGRREARKKGEKEREKEERGKVSEGRRRKKKPAVHQRGDGEARLEWKRIVSFSLLLLFSWCKKGRARGRFCDLFQAAEGRARQRKRGNDDVLRLRGSKYRERCRPTTLVFLERPLSFSRSPSSLPPLAESSKKREISEREPTNQQNTHVSDPA